MINLHTAFLTGAPGSGELILLFVVILVLFGPKRLPEISKMVGKTLSQLRRGADDFKDQIMKIDDSDVIELNDDDDPFGEEEETAEETADEVKDNDLRE